MASGGLNQCLYIHFTTPHTAGSWAVISNKLSQSGPTLASFIVTAVFLCGDTANRSFEIGVDPAPLSCIDSQCYPFTKLTKWNGSEIVVD